MRPRHSKATRSQNSLYKPLAIGAIFGLASVMVTWVFFFDVNLFPGRLLRLTIYSMVILVPVLIMTFLGLAGIPTPEPIFYLYVFIVPFLFFFGISLMHFKLKKDPWWVIFWTTAAIILYTAFSVYALW